MLAHSLQMQQRLAVAVNGALSRKPLSTRPRNLERAVRRLREKAARTVNLGAAAMTQNQANAAVCTAAGASRVAGNQATARSRSCGAEPSAVSTRAATAWKYLRTMELHIGHDVGVGVCLLLTKSRAAVISLRHSEDDQQTSC